MKFLASTCQVLVIDVQERLFPHIENHLTLENNLLKLLQGLRLFTLPTTVSQQYSKGLGATIPLLHPFLKEACFLEKSTFSCVEEEAIKQHLLLQNRNQIIICGIEAHICVQQTALDLAEKGFDVCVVADCIGARSEFSKTISMHRLLQEGIRICTVESLLFELCRDSKNPIFKSITEIIK